MTEPAKPGQETTLSLPPLVMFLLRLFLLPRATAPKPLRSLNRTAYHHRRATHHLKPLPRFQPTLLGKTLLPLYLPPFFSLIATTPATCQKPPSIREIFFPQMPHPQKNQNQIPASTLRAKKFHPLPHPKVVGHLPSKNHAQPAPKSRINPPHKATTPAKTAPPTRHRELEPKTGFEPVTYRLRRDDFPMENGPPVPSGAHYRRSSSN